MNTRWRPAPARPAPARPAPARPAPAQPDPAQPDPAITDLAVTDLAGPGPHRDRNRLLMSSMRGLGAVIFLLLVAATFQAKPGLSPGERIPVTILLALLCGAFVAAGLRSIQPRARFALLLIAALSAVALVRLGVTGPGVYGVFATGAASGLRLPVRYGVPLLVVAITANSVAWLTTGTRPASDILLNDCGVIAFFLMATFGGRLRESNERAEGMLAELRSSRAAQAEAAVLAERQRLAREMHDVLAHSLAGLLLNLEGARLLAAGGAPGERVADSIDRAHRLAKAGLEEARNAIGMLRDDELPGPERLAGLTAQFTSDTGVPCELMVTGAERDVGSDGRLTLYRVGQEALTNIRKHATPDRVQVTLGYEAGGTRLAIEDSGTLAPAAGGDGDGGPAGYGLTGMRERAELLGGTLTAGPTGSGFRVALWIPA